MGKGDDEMLEQRQCTNCGKVIISKQEPINPPDYEVTYDSWRPPSKELMQALFSLGFDLVPVRTCLTGQTDIRLKDSLQGLE